jgi:SAM-dependent methyltransferase
MPAARPHPLSDLEHVYWELLERRPYFPGARLIKIRSDWREQDPPSGPAAALFKRNLAAAGTVLDVGAGDRLWESVLRRMEIGGAYLSADVERRHEHDFEDFLQVEESFDAILMLELLEHLPLELGLRFLDHAVSLLNPGGALVIGTPNAHHAHQVWSADLTHIRPWPAHDLWALCSIAGLQRIAIYRQLLVTPRRRIVVPLQLVLSRLLGIDPAYGLLLFAHKPGDL